MASTVSVVIPTYNREKVISTALESVLAQTYTDYEIIVLDDGSTDNTRDLIRSYADRQVRYFYQDNKGIAGARNAGIRACSGAYIAFLDSDDYWLPGKLEQQMALFGRHPEYGPVASCCASVRYDGSFRATNRSGTSGRVLRELFKKNYIRTSAAVVTRQCLDTVGLFDESLKECEEYDLWLRIAAEYPIGFINEPLAVYVDNPAGVSTDSLIGRLYRLQVLEKDYLQQHIPRRLYRRRIADTCHYIGRHYLSRGQSAEGRAYLRRAQKLAPLYIKNLIYVGLSLLRT
jgi:glycosyltransferase involved in cell wall biosynthesis